MDARDFPQYYRWLTISDQQMVGVLFCAMLAGIAVLWLITARYSFPRLLPVVSVSLAVAFFTIGIFFSGGPDLAIEFNAILVIAGAFVVIRETPTGTHYDPYE